MCSSMGAVSFVEDQGFPLTFWTDRTRALTDQVEKTGPGGRRTRISRPGANSFHLRIWRRRHRNTQAVFHPAARPP